MKKRTHKAGFSLLEILLAITIFSIFTIGITYLSIDTLDNNVKMSTNNEALLYAQEGIEATRNIRDESFLALINGEHGLTFQNKTWSFAPSPEPINNYYQRTISISDVYRDVAGNIDPDGDIYDPDTKKIESTVTWMQRGVIPRSVTLTEYLSNWRSDDWLRTTCTEFNLGTFDTTELITLSSPPNDNCGIKPAGIEVGSGFQSSADMGKHASDVDIEGNYAYLALNDVNKGLDIVDISDKENPTLVGFKDISGKGRYILKDGNYVYAGVEKSNAGLSIIDVSNPSSPSIASTTNIGAYGNQPAIIGNYLYQAVNQTSNSLKIYNVTSKNSPSLVRTINFGATIRFIKIRGNYAYLGLESSTAGLKVLNIADPTNPQTVGTLNVGAEVRSIAFNGNVGYLATSSSANSLKVVDFANPATPSPLTSIDTNGAIQDLATSGDYLYAAVDRIGYGLAAVNISNAYVPYFVYSLDVGGKGTGIDADEDYIYITTDTANKGLVVVGETVTGSASDGTYTSDILDTGSSETIYNFIEWDQIFAPGSSIKFQIRTADTAENLSTATWVGVDGTAATYYENSRTAITLSPDSSGTRYIQYKAFLTSDGVTPPILESVRINYTP